MILPKPATDWTLRWKGPVPVYILEDGTYRSYKRGVKDGKYVKPKPTGFAITYLGSGVKDVDGTYVLDGKSELLDDKGKVLVTTIGLPFVPYQRTEDTAFMVVTLKQALNHIRPLQTWQRPELSLTPDLTWVNEFRLETDPGVE
jgi:hypothetical protein